MERKRKRVQKFFSKPSLTRQEFKDECDLSLIVKRFCRTPDGQRALQDAMGFVEGLNFEDVTNVPDFRTARDLVIQANDRFMQLPAAVRKRFDNDPASFLDFATNPDNLGEMRAMGLANPEAQVVAKSATTEPAE